MAEAKEKAVSVDANKAALQKFEAGLARSIKQYAGRVATFEDKELFLAHLRQL